MLMAMLITSSSYAQIDKYKVEGFTSVKLDNNGFYVYQKPWTVCDYTLVINMPKKRIEILTDTQSLEYTVKDVKNAYKDSEGDVLFPMLCDNDKGKQCILVLITLVKPIEGYQNYLKVEYGDGLLLFRYHDNDNK